MNFIEDFIKDKKLENVEDGFMLYDSHHLETNIKVYLDFFKKYGGDIDDSLIYDKFVGWQEDEVFCDFEEAGVRLTAQFLESELKKLQNHEKLENEEYTKELFNFFSNYIDMLISDKITALKEEAEESQNTALRRHK